MYGTPGYNQGGHGYPGQQQGYPGQQQQQCPHNPMCSPANNGPCMQVMNAMMGHMGQHMGNVMSGHATPGTVMQTGFGMMGAMMNAAAQDQANMHHGGHGGHGGAYQQPPYNPGHGQAPPPQQPYGGAPPAGSFSVNINMGGAGAAPPSGHVHHGGAPPGAYVHGGAAPPSSSSSHSSHSHGYNPPSHGSHSSQTSTTTTYSHGGGPGAVMDDHSFARFLASVQKATFSSDKHNAVNVGLAGGATKLTCSQISQVVAAFPHSSDKVQCCVACYRSCVDPQHWQEVLNTLAHSSARDQVMQQIGGQGHSGHGGHGGHHGHHGHSSSHGAPPSGQGYVGHGTSHGAGYGHSAASQQDFNRFLQSVNSATFSSDKHSAIQIGLRGGIRLNCQQATQVLRAMPHDSDKIQAAVTVYPSIVDKQHFAEVLNNGLSFSSSRDSVKKQLGL